MSTFNEDIAALWAYLSQSLPLCDRQLKPTFDAADHALRGVENEIRGLLGVLDEVRDAAQASLKDDLADQRRTLKMLVEMLRDPTNGWDNPTD